MAMKGPQLWTDDAWARISELAREKRRGPALVAVPYLGEGAPVRLPLRSGDTLVTRFDDLAFKSGLVDPKAVVAYIEAGVEVHAVFNLHAKVFVFGRRAVVGSTNVSTHSAEHLIEAECESESSRFVGAVASFVRKLRGDVVGLEFARRKIPLYHSPNYPAGTRRTTGGRALHSDVAVVKLARLDWDSADDAAYDGGLEEAQERVVRRDRFSVDSFRWTGKPPRTLRRDLRVIRCTAVGARKILVDAPARVLSMRRYKSKRGSRTMVFVETQKWSRARSLTSVIRKVPKATLLRTVSSFRIISDRDLARQLG
jgi:hypothetical protein